MTPTRDQIEVKPPKPKLSKGRYGTYVKQTIEKKGHKFLSINWKKRKIHYVTQTGVRMVTHFFGLPPGL